jgi:protein gp37
MIKLNKTKIEWTDYTWNPITGCKHGCWYCYANRMFTRFHRSFEPQFHPERLMQPLFLKKPSKIFCCSVSDIFASWTKPEWRDDVLEVIKICQTDRPFLTFQLLTKQPEGAIPYYFEKNTWLGATITRQDELDKINVLKSCHAVTKFVSFEPLLEEIDTEKPYSHYDEENGEPCYHWDELADLDGIDWIIIGKLTGSRRIKLQKEWVEKLIEQARGLDIPIFIKNNVNWHKRIQEFPRVESV